MGSRWTSSGLGACGQLQAPRTGCGEDRGGSDRAAPPAPRSCRSLLPNPPLLSPHLASPPVEESRAPSWGFWRVKGWATQAQWVFKEVVWLLSQPEERHSWFRAGNVSLGLYSLLCFHIPSHIFSPEKKISFPILKQGGEKAFITFPRLCTGLLVVSCNNNRTVILLIHPQLYFPLMQGAVQLRTSILQLLSYMMRSLAVRKSSLSGSQVFIWLQMCKLPYRWTN